MKRSRIIEIIKEEIENLNTYEFEGKRYIPSYEDFDFDSTTIQAYSEEEAWEKLDWRNNGWAKVSLVSVNGEKVLKEGSDLPDTRDGMVQFMIDTYGMKDGTFNSTPTAKKFWTYNRMMQYHYAIQRGEKRAPNSGTLKEDSNELLSQLEKELKSHDWFYAMSDDHRYYKSGMRHREEINNLISQINSAGLGEEGESIWRSLAPDVYKDRYPTKK